MGFEHTYFPLLEAAAARRPVSLPARRLGPGDHPSANHVLMEAAVAYVAAPDGPANGGTNRQRIERIGRSQAEAEPGRREGLGAVEGRVEQFTPDPHAGFHLLPTLVVIQHARLRGEVPIAELWTRVLGGWWSLWSLGASADGQVVNPGLRFWPVKGRPEVEADGLVHLRPGATLSQCVDGAHRLLQGLPQRDNKGGTRNWEWARKREAPGWAAVVLLHDLLEGGLAVTKQEPKVVFPVARRAGPEETRLWFTRTAEEVGGTLHSLAPAVQATWRAPGRHELTWAPRTVPEGFDRGQAPIPV
jgi:hypothetical protein